MAYFYLFLLLSCYCCCNAQPPPRNVYDFKTSTWNTNGQKWDRISQLILQENLDVMVIQEAGTIKNIKRQWTSPAGLPNIPVILDDVQLNPGSDIGLTEYIWTLNNQRYYVYYDNNFQTSIKQSMATISRHRAQEIIIISSQVSHDSSNHSVQQENAIEKTFINRPVIGIRIENGVFFNIHTEPTRVRNEAATLLKLIEHEMMHDSNKHQTWMVMGDFNRTPEELEPHLQQLSPNRYRAIVRTGQPTRITGELDYAIVGGPTPIGTVRAVLANLAFRNPSDHNPVRFN